MDNIIGRNIKALREQHGETLQDLADTVFLSYSTIGMYETGKRKIDFEKLQTIANHYGHTVDEILRLNMKELPEMGTIGTWQDIIERMSIITPVICSEQALRNNHFKSGYDGVKKIIEKTRHCENASMNEIEHCIESFEQALDDKVDEAAANLLWIVFILWNSVLNAENVSLMTPLMNGKGQDKEYVQKLSVELNTGNNCVSKNPELKAFVNDMNESICFCIRVLKESPEYKMLGDYYLALRYIVGMVDNDCSRAMNRQIGMEMIFANISIGNKYAFDFYQECIK